jgi:sialate O-acetylesterase
MSAVADHFARKLNADLGVPVAVICSSRGSTRIQSWIPVPVFESDPAFAHDREQWQKDLAEWPAKKPAWEKREADWKIRAAAAARVAKKSEPKRPQRPSGPGHYNQPGSYYNAMISPVTKVPVRGFLWYQGEADARRAARYYKTLPALITSWREAWGRGDLPFLIVQLAAYRAPGFAPGGLERAGLREAQALAVEHLPATGLVVTLDVSGPESKEHPRDKRPVGERLARLAEALACGRCGLTVNGPTFTAVSFGDGTARISWRPGTANGLHTADAAPPSAFEIAGADRKFHPAGVRIENSTTIILASRDVPSPVAVRYAFRNDPRVNLINTEGLPAAPFRTDDWPLSPEEQISPGGVVW